VSSVRRLPGGSAYAKPLDDGYRTNTSKIKAFFMDFQKNF
jgi:hypothetical protein